MDWRTRGLTILGILVFAMGIVIIYLGNARMEENRTQYSYAIFGSYSFHEYATNKTYHGAGGPDFHNCWGDTFEVSAIHPPATFNGSLSNVYLAVWDGGNKPNLPGNTPDEMITMSILPRTHTSLRSDLSFELLSAEPLQNLGWNHYWSIDFVRKHSIPQNSTLLFTGIAIVGAGFATIALANYGLRRSLKTLPPPPPQF